MASPADVADLVGRITQIKQVISSGVDAAAYGDKRTDFRSLNDLREILSDLEDELADLLGMNGRTRQYRMYSPSDKGL
jgi:hypothetical protein